MFKGVLVPLLLVGVAFPLLAQCELNKLTSSDGMEHDYFGATLTAHHGVAFLAAWFADGAESGAGAVYLYRSLGSEWIEEQVISASDGKAGDYFGVSVAADSERVMVGAYLASGVFCHSGAAYLYRHDGNQWTEEHKLTAPDAASGDIFGLAVSVDGDVALVGAPGSDAGGDNRGCAYLFRHTES
ncbi:MAG: FG-GAP repeat protein, partial [Planctomycetota bacterium]